jgi:hypothetical protein
MVDLYQRQINKLESKEKSEDEELRRKRQKLADAQKTIDDLEMFYTKVTADWCDSERRNIGQILYSPPFEFNVGDEGSTGDWGTFELDGVPCQGRLPSGKLHLSFCTLLLHLNTFLLRRDKIKNFMIGFSALFLLI